MRVGPGWVIARIGAGATALFAAMHIPAAIVGILLLQWRRPALPRTWRVALEAATLYFGLAVLVSLALNYMLASLIDDMMPR